MDATLAGLATIDAVRRACTAAGEPDPLDEAAALALAHHGLDGATAATAGSDGSGEGFALVRDGDLVLAVAPEARRRGVASRLLTELSDTGANINAGAHQAWSHGDHPGAIALARRHGWRRTRELWVMRRGLGPEAAPLPSLPPPPTGLRLRAYADGDAHDERELLRVNAAAFAHHPEQGDLDAEGFAERRAEAWWDPAGLILAVTDDELLRAFHWTKRHSPTLGEVYVVGVDPGAQGGGLGRLVTLAGLHHLAGGGAVEVLLYVESDNGPAVHVYSGLGFTHTRADTHVQYRRPA